MVGLRRGLRWDGSQVMVGVRREVEVEIGFGLFTVLIYKYLYKRAQLRALFFGSCGVGFGF